MLKKLRFVGGAIALIVGATKSKISNGNQVAYELSPNMSLFGEEQVAVLLIILGVLALGSVFYGSTLHMIKDQQKQSDTKTTSPSVAVVPPSPKQNILPPLPSPEEQELARGNQIDLLQRSIESKFDDVDTYFTTKSLMESARSLVQQQVQKQRDNYYDHVERLYMIRNQQPLPIVPPQANVPQVPDERIPWLPHPGSWDPLMERIPNPRPMFDRRDGDVLRQARPLSPAPTGYFLDNDNSNARRVADWLNGVPFGRR